jgi:hypothetical protein
MATVGCSRPLLSPVNTDSPSLTLDEAEARVPTAEPVHVGLCERVRAYHRDPLTQTSRVLGLSLARNYYRLGCTLDGRRELLDLAATTFLRTLTSRSGPADRSYPSASSARDGPVSGTM